MRPDFLCLPRGSIVRLLFVAWALWLAAAGCSAASGHTRHAPVAAAEPAPPAAVAVPAGEEAELVLMNRQIVRFRAAFLGAPPRQRAERGRLAIVAQLERGGSDTVSVQPNPVGNIVLVGGQLAFVLTPRTPTSSPARPSTPSPTPPWRPSARPSPNPARAATARPSSKAWRCRPGSRWCSPSCSPGSGACAAGSPAASPLPSTRKPAGCGRAAPS
jgi:hypothetical protein